MLLLNKSTNFVRNWLFETFENVEPEIVDWNSQNLKPTANQEPLPTLDSGINIPPGITVAPPLKNFHITILILFYINLGIAVIFKFFLSSKFFKN